MKLDIIMLENEIEHAKKGDTRCARNIFIYLQRKLKASEELPDALRKYLAEATDMVLEGESADRAFNLLKKPGNQYTSDTTLKEIRIATMVYDFQKHLKWCKKTGNKPELSINHLNPEALTHLDTNFDTTIEAICDFLSEHKLVPHITNRTPKNKPQKNVYMKADNIQKIYNRWAGGLQATEEE